MATRGTGYRCCKVGDEVGSKRKRDGEESPPVLPKDDTHESSPHSGGAPPTGEASPKGMYLASLVDTLLLRQNEKFREQQNQDYKKNQDQAGPSTRTWPFDSKASKQKCAALNECMSNIKKHLIRVGASDKWLEEVASLSPPERRFDIMGLSYH